MKTKITAQTLASIVALALQAARAQDASGLQIEPPASDTPNRFGLSYRMGFNMPVSFKNLGGFALPPRLTPNGTPYNYDDGYVYNDINGSAFNNQFGTWNWGYDAAPGQYTLGDNYLVMHRSTSQANVESSDRSDDPQSGFEVTFRRELHRSAHWSLGLDAAFGYTSVSVNDSSALMGNVSQTSYLFAVPKDPETGYGITYFTPTYPGPWQNQFQGNADQSQNPHLANQPTSSATQVLPGGALISGSRQFSANLYGFRLGPSLELQVSKRVSLDLSAGFALAYVESDFSFNQTVSVPGVGFFSQSGSGSGSAWQPGGFVAGNCSVALSDRWSAVAGAQFQSLGQYTQEVNGKQAVLDLSKAIFVTVGVSYSF